MTTGPTPIVSEFRPGRRPRRRTTSSSVPTGGCGSPSRAPELHRQGGRQRRQRDETAVTTPPTPTSRASRSPDGNLWFTQQGDTTTAVPGAIWRMPPTPGVTPTAFTVTTGAHPMAITPGPDGKHLVTDQGNNAIGVMSPAGTLIQEYTVPSANAFSAASFSSLGASRRPGRQHLVLEQNTPPEGQGRTAARPAHGEHRPNPVTFTTSVGTTGTVTVTATATAGAPRPSPRSASRPPPASALPTTATVVTTRQPVVHDEGDVHPHLIGVVTGT